MTPQNSLKVQSVIAFAIPTAMGVSVIGLACLNQGAWIAAVDAWIFDYWR
jgi:hypothetical protein